MTALPLHDGWTLRPVDGPIPVDLVGAPIPAVVPGCVHTDLLRGRAHRRPVRRRQRGRPAVDRRHGWRYRTRVQLAAPDGAARHDLVAEGLDTVATVDAQRRGARPDREPAPRLPVRRARGCCVAGGNELAVEFAAPGAGGTSAVRRSTARAARQPPPVQRRAQDGLQLRLGLGHRRRHRRHLAADRASSRWSGVRIASVRPLVDVDGEHRDAHRPCRARTGDRPPAGGVPPRSPSAVGPAGDRRDAGRQSTSPPPRRPRPSMLRVPHVRPLVADRARRPAAVRRARSRAAAAGGHADDVDGPGRFPHRRAATPPRTRTAPRSRSG